MRRNIRRQTDRNTGCAVDQQVRIARRQHIRLLQRIIEVKTERNGILVNIPKHFQRKRRHSRFRITHRRRAVSVNRAEVAMAIDQQRTHAVRLCHTNHGVVDRAVAMRMIFTETIADDTRTLFMRLIGRHAQLAERKQNPALNGLESILHTRERTFQNDMLRIGNHGNVHNLVHGLLNNLMTRCCFLGRLSAVFPACHYFAFPSRARNVSTLLKSAYVVI